ncbi:hypothetical protein BJ322DRAFT_1102454 [Thelephora terrestris]|uniref:F-box domain-containing protein n=1 Tax=Thelephora terrestris TaxID=56493 RepID=A0A9P6HRY1_9AGAM|nr:hypothetical protein BJ322DRAFT_1102454 [Thelephora terrestris]
MIDSLHYILALIHFRASPQQQSPPIKSSSEFALKFEAGFQPISSHHSIAFIIFSSLPLGFSFGENINRWVTLIAHACAPTASSLTFSVDSHLCIVCDAFAMQLPPELIEEIIGHLPPHDKEALRNCSLVAKLWMYPSQKRLFEVVDVNQWNLQYWIDRISPTDTRLLEHVCYLNYRGSQTIADRTPVHRALHDYLPSFCRLRGLTLVFATISSYTEHIEPFSAFKFTLSRLLLAGCNITKSALVALINYFPNLTCISLTLPGYTQENERTPPLSRTLFKKLRVRSWPAQSLVPLEEVFLVNIVHQTTWPHFSKRIVDIFGESVKCLRLLGGYRGDRYCLTLSHCRELRELEASTLCLKDAKLGLLSSITSTKIEKIILASQYGFERLVEQTHWTKLDAVLIELAERSMHGPRLEVAFRDVNGGWDKNTDFSKYLPKFVERGRVVVLGRGHEVPSDEVWGRNLFY